jgi:hypothetical protein
MLENCHLIVEKAAFNEARRLAYLFVKGTSMSRDVNASYARTRLTACRPRGASIRGH